MTRLGLRRLVRDTGALVDRRELVVELAAEGIYLRGKRERRSSALFLSWATAFTHAAWCRRERIRAEKKAARKARREAS